MTIIESVKNYITAKCPYLEADCFIDFNYLSPSFGSFSIEEVSSDIVLKKFTDGGSLRKFVFILTCRQPFEGYANLKLSEFFENFSAWLENCSEKGDFPVLGNGKIPQKLEAVSHEVCKSNTLNSTQGQITCNLIYKI